MRTATLFFFMLFIVSAISGKEKKYTASTPADAVIRSFLGIPLKDSVDFIRWRLTLADNAYTLNCNYGVGKPNTNGFWNGGKTVNMTGTVKKEKNFYELNNEGRVMRLAELNNDLLHLLNTDNSLLVGNGGWSYTLNSLEPSGSENINLTPSSTVLKDSIAFEGRTPCNVPGIIPAGTECYKLKWYIVLYADAGKNKPTTYRVLGTPWRKQGGRTGNWKIVTEKDGRTIYQLDDEKGNGFLYLLKADEHILVFTNAGGKLLVGDEDFSYTLNRSSSL